MLGGSCKMTYKCSAQRNIVNISATAFPPFFKQKLSEKIPSKIFPGEKSKICESISHILLMGSFYYEQYSDIVLSLAFPQCLFLRHALCPWHEGQEEEGSSRNLALLSPRSISRGSLLWFNISPAKAAFILHLNTMRSELPKALEKSKYRSQSRADFPEMRSTKNSFLIKSCKSPY